jgi:hypothetical protein
MARSYTRLLALVVLGGLRCVPALAQAPTPTPPPAGVAPGSPLAGALADLAVGPLPPPIQPRTDLPGPYFTPDPLLDPAELPPPGWWAEADLIILNPHVRYWSNIRGPVTFRDGSSDTVTVTGAHLDWTVAPRVLLGYRLPAGFGSFAVGLKYFGTDGSQVVPGPDGPSSVRSRLDVTLADFLYRAEEFSLWPWMDMRWWAGGRFSNLFFDTHQSTSFALAGAGSGVLDRAVSNRYVGFGPLAGLEAAWFVHGRELSLLGRVEGAVHLGRIRQQFAETNLNDSGAPQQGASSFSSSQDVPMLNVQIGLRWQPSPRFDLFLGYQYEHFWNAGRLNAVPVSTNNETGTQGEVYDHGIVLRAALSF